MQTMNFVFVVYYIFTVDGEMEISSNHVLFLGMFWKSYDVLPFHILVTMTFQMCL